MEEERTALVTSLQDLIADNKKFVKETVTQLYDAFASVYTFMSSTCSDEIPADILSLRSPLFPDQPDTQFTLKIPAGSVHEHPISVTVIVCEDVHSQAGSHVKWLFEGEDDGVRFSVVFNDAATGEAREVEESHRVKGDGRFDL